MDDEVPPAFYNLTIYVSHDEVRRVGTFYRDALGLHPLFKEENHIECFELLPRISLCIHEEEEDHAAGSTELRFGTDASSTFMGRAAAAGLSVTSGKYVDGGDWILVTDSSGTQVHLSRDPRPA